MTDEKKFRFVNHDLNDVPMKEAKYIRFPCQECGTYRYGDKPGTCLIPVNGHKTSKGAKWDLSGTPEAPTLSPSIRCLTGKELKTTMCHFFLRNGKFNHCKDHPRKKK